MIGKLKGPGLACRDVKINLGRRTDIRLVDVTWFIAGRSKD